MLRFYIISSLLTKTVLLWFWILVVVLMLWSNDVVVRVWKPKIMTDTLKKKKPWLVKSEKSQSKNEKSHSKSEKNQVKYYLSNIN